MNTGRTYCTLFDGSYLTRGLALYASLLRQRADAQLIAVCFDDDALEILEALALPRLAAVPLAALEAFDPELEATKAGRTRAEYCWTATPCLARFVLATNPDLGEVTYLDADLRFFGDPEVLFEEMGDDSTLITPHRFAPEYRHYEVAGTYNVQFVTFRRDADALATLEWWRERCLEWCYNRLEPGRMGDQKYLDEWPRRFAGVHSLQHIGGGVAPWNVTQYAVTAGPTGPLVDGTKAVFYHYHGLRLSPGGRHVWRTAAYPLSATVGRLFYEPYFADLASALAQVRAVRPGFAEGFAEDPPLRERLATARAVAGARGRRLLMGARS